MTAAAILVIGWTIFVGVGTVIISWDCHEAGRRRGRIEGYNEGFADGRRGGEQ